MKPIWLVGAIAVSLGGLWWLVTRSPFSVSTPTAVLPTTPASTVPRPLEPLEYKSYTLPQSTIYTLRVPPHSQFAVTTAIAATVGTLETIARQEGAIAALNGGFFDPENQQSTAYVRVEGKQVGDPRLNDRLMHNPDLAPYLSQILDRSEFRQYQCGDRLEYAIALHNAAVPPSCQLVNALGGGPRLLPTSTAQQEGFVAEANGVVIRDALGSRQPNARTAIGITRDRSILWVMVAQTSEHPTTSGMTLQALTDFMKTLGVEQAMNLDGGSSASLYYNGKTVYGKRDASGKPVMRSVKSVLLLKRNQ